jgi:hypothetical protein
MTNERLSTRIEVNKETHFVSWLSGMHLGVMIECSVNGCSMKCDRPPKLGETLIIAMPNEEGDVKRRASVIWTEGVRFGTEFFKDEDERTVSIH